MDVMGERPFIVALPVRRHGCGLGHDIRDAGGGRTGCDLATASLAEPYKVERATRRLAGSYATVLFVLGMVGVGLGTG